ncbi:sulfite exporter TauE/SafE family protein [Hyphomicrobium sp.]|uniref:sulfite exporter TauE/SafE family protein n=1 Tax=Hyphomicrobium sp. TaxID=82 RepID=UPI0013284F50|nr:sulfite exporter TauE/SafE family protein [Hyphomicrobium sp.]KAB2941367.1 MAG: sulfite exporter TauE/SafE family protein [Hyphomicrobium sp.]MCZ7595915.1 sulfite exporter TauE/SafE family protein [Hyphomicrobium sp.]
MNIYLPIAEMSVNVALFLGMGCAVGFLSGLFGVGGGFLLTPLLIFMGVPTAVAVGTGSMQILASSVSGALAQYRRRNVDVKMGAVLVVGGVAGSIIGVSLMKILRQVGQFDLFVSLSYVTFLGAVGALMLIESIGSIQRTQAGQAVSVRKTGQHSWVHGLPLKMRFHRSKLYISALPPAMIGAFVGFMAAIMGVGGGFVMVPAMIYLLRVPTSIVIGTSLFQIVFVMAVTTLLQAMQNKAVDVVLALLLIVGGVIGAQFGAAAGGRLKGEQLRFMLAALVLLVCLRIGWDLMVKPSEVYSIGPVIGG